MRHIILVSLSLLSSLAPAAGKPLQELPISKIEAMKQKPCTFMHVWATWCTVCVQEMPETVRVLAGMKKVTPVVVDVSSPLVQEQFSKKWNVLLDAPFVSYFKPKGKDETYLNAIDKDWSGALPFSVLYDKGKRKKVWVGALDLKALPNEVGALCEKNR